MKNYNVTDLDPQTTFERHVFHRDQFAHYLRWSHILKESKVNKESILDFGCGKGNLLEVLYRNKFKAKYYTGIDIRKQTINQAKEKFNGVKWASFICDDLCNPKTDFSKIKADKVCSFEVIEHVGKNRAQIFLNNFKSCGHKDSVYYLSTPNFDEKVGAAGNHTYDSGDGLGIQIQEFEHSELEKLILKSGFIVVKKYGTFASISDYKHLLNDWQKKMFNYLKEYYDTNILSCLMAPMFPEQSRNTLWILKQK